MKRALYFVGIITVLYTAAALTWPLLGEVRFGERYNDFRLSQNLRPLNEKWSMDSSRTTSEGTILYWSTTNLTSTPFAISVRKEIYYQESFWLWRNVYEGETDFYKRTYSTAKSQQLLIGFDAINDRQMRLLAPPVLIDSQQVDTSNALYRCGTTSLPDFEEVHEIPLDDPSASVIDSVIFAWQLIHE